MVWGMLELLTLGGGLVFAGAGWLGVRNWQLRQELDRLRASLAVSVRPGEEGADAGLQAAPSLDTSEASQRAQAYVQSLIDVIPQPVFVRDAAGRYVLINEACANALGKPRERIIGCTPEGIGTPVELASEILHEDSEVFAGRVIYKEV